MLLLMLLLLAASSSAAAVASDDDDDDGDNNNHDCAAAVRAFTPCVHRSIIAADCSAKIVIFRCHAPPVDLHPRKPAAFLFSGGVQRLTPQCSQWTRLLDVMVLALGGGEAGVERLDGRMSGADR